MAEADGAQGLAAWAAARGMSVEDGVHLPRTTPLLAEGEVHSVDALAGSFGAFFHARSKEMNEEMEKAEALLHRRDAAGDAT